MDMENIRKSERSRYDKSYYENVYWAEDIPGKKCHTMFRYADPNHEKRFRFLAAILLKNFEFRTTLDAGCGMGHVVRNLLDAGVAARGLEVSKDAIKNYMPDLEKKGLVVLSSIDKMPFRDNEFDMVFCSDVMEHIPSFDVKASIKELIRVTGKYLVLTINMDNPYEYHPTILPRKEWETMFLESGELKHLLSKQRNIERECKKDHKEYDFFVFQKIK